MKADFAFFEREAGELARALLGCVVRVGGCAGRIVEVEAYLGIDDGASHSVRGVRAAVAALAAGPGTLYVHPMRQNVGVDIVGLGGMVLLRALEPLEGIEEMRVRRGRERLEELCSGPAKLTRALGITRAMDGLNVLEDGCPVEVYEGEGGFEVGVGPRVGITKSTGLALRSWVRGSRFLSRKERDA